jgi:hypothetical protein
MRADGVVGLFSMQGWRLQVSESKMPISPMISAPEGILDS